MCKGPVAGQGLQGFEACIGAQGGGSGEESGKMGIGRIALGLAGHEDELGLILNATGDRYSILSSVIWPNLHSNDCSGCHVLCCEHFVGEQKRMWGIRRWLH